MTVLEQDHFYSDILNLHVTSQATEELWWCQIMPCKAWMFLRSNLQVWWAWLAWHDWTALLCLWCGWLLLHWRGNCCIRHLNKHKVLYRMRYRMHIICSAVSLNNLRLQHFQFIALTPMIIAIVSLLLVVHREMRCHQSCSHRHQTPYACTPTMDNKCYRWGTTHCATFLHQHFVLQKLLGRGGVLAISHDCTWTGSLLQWYPKLTCNKSGHKRTVMMLEYVMQGLSILEGHPPRLMNLACMAWLNSSHVHVVCLGNRDSPHFMNGHTTTT